VPPLAANVTVTAPPTVAPAAGLVNDALSSVPFWTVTVRLARGDGARAVTHGEPSVWLASPYVVVSTSTLVRTARGNLRASTVSV